MVKKYDHKGRKFLFHLVSYHTYVNTLSKQNSSSHRGPSPFRVFAASRRAQLEAQLPAGHPSLRPQKLTPRLSEEWNAMTPEERRPFETIASEQARQTEEGPKHNSWHMFMYQRRPYLEDACRDTTGRVNRTKLIGILNEQWRRMTDEEKAPYVLQAQHSRNNDGNSILVCTFPTFCILPLNMCCRSSLLRRLSQTFLTQIIATTVKIYRHCMLSHPVLMII